MNELTAEFEKTFIRDDRYKVFVTGFKNTILITLVSLCVGLIAGILIAIARYGFRQMKRKAAVTWYAKLWYAICWVADKILALYVAVIRGVPLVVQLLIMAFVVMAGFPNKIVVLLYCDGTELCGLCIRGRTWRYQCGRRRTDGGGTVTRPEYGDNYFLYHFAAGVQVRTSGAL